MKYHYKKMNIRQVIFLFLFFVTLVSVFIASLFLSNIARDIILEEAKKNRSEVLSLIGANVDNVINEAVDILQNLYFDPDIVKIFEDDELSDYITAKNNRQLAEVQVQHAGFSSSIEFYITVDANNGYVRSLISTDAADYMPFDFWEEALVNNDAPYQFHSTEKYIDSVGNELLLFNLVRQMNNNYLWSSNGLLVISIDESALYECYGNQILPQSEIVVLDQEGKIVSSNGKDLIGMQYQQSHILAEADKQQVVNNTESIVHGGHLYSFYSIPQTDWTIVDKVPLSTLLEPLNRLWLLFAIVMIISLFASYTIAFYASKRISIPIQALCEVVKKIKNGNVAVEFDIDGVKEVEVLADGIRDMSENLLRLLQEKIMEERLKRKSEIKFLRAQINPHFIHNTLTSIRCMVIMGQTSEAEQMILSLNKLLRNIFQNSNEMSPLRDEIKILESYIEIQRIRYNNSFTMIFDVKDEVLDVDIPVLMLQPILENAIFHGVATNKTNGLIIIGGRIVGDDVVITIKDNGIGIDEEKLCMLNNNQLNNDTSSNSIGIKNVNERMVLYYGKEYHLVFTSSLEDGTTALLRIPQNQKPNKERELLKDV